MSVLPLQGGVILRTFVPDSGFGTYAMHVDRHGQFTLKQLRLSLVNETHTKLYTGPRLARLPFIFDDRVTVVDILYAHSAIYHKGFLVFCMRF